MLIAATERLTIREFELDDWPFVLRLLNDPSFIRHIADKGVHTREQAETYLQEGPRASYRTHGHGLYLVARKDTGAPIGMCGLIKRDTLDTVDLGYAFVPEGWGQGFARESAVAVLEQGRKAHGFERTVAIVSPDNERSIHLLTQTGFAYRKIITWPHDGVEVALYERVGS